MSRKSEITENIDKTAGMRIQKRRLEMGLSRAQLALKIGVTHQQLQKYEKGTNRISFGRMCGISKALGKPLDYFCNNADFISESNDFSDNHHRMAIETTRNFMKIKSVVNQYAAAQLVKSLAENK